MGGTNRINPEDAAQAPPFRFFSTETFDFESSILGQTLRVSVQLPIRRKDGSERFPVLYTTDAQTGVRFEEVNIWMQWGGEVPRFIAVDIGYPSWAEWHLRGSHLTPTDNGRPLVDYGDGLIDWSPPLPEGARSGNAPDFLRSIREELKPFVDSSYPTLPQEDSYFGNSFGGLFGAYVLLNRPDTFRTYILGSPALAWDDGVLLKQAEDLATSGETVPARVFMGVGSLEPETYHASVKRLGRALARVKGVSLETRVFDGDSHGTAFAASYAHGVRWAFGTPETYFLEDHGER